MDVDLIFITAATGLAAIATVIVVLLPAWAAWIIAWRSGMPKPYRRSFALVCLLLSYGVLMLAGALMLPLEVFKTFIAPDLHGRGHVVLGNTIFVLAEQGVPIILCGGPGRCDLHPPPAAQALDRDQGRPRVASGSGSRPRGLTGLNRRGLLPLACSPVCGMGVV